MINITSNSGRTYVKKLLLIGSAYKNSLKVIVLKMLAISIYFSP